MATSNAELIRDAEQAYHALLTGTSPRVVVDQNGQRVEYTAASRLDLYNYIQRLKAAQPGGNPALAAYGGPAQFLF